MKLINISGSSGVGKTTIGKILSWLYPSSMHLCGDDLHKWERGDLNWERFTHLNPEANNLDLGLYHITSLLSNNTITRKKYSHETGKFETGISLDPQFPIINEGLHSLYLDEMCQLSDVNIFVDTNEELKFKWKLNRDTKKRGYTVDKVLQTIRKRKVDEDKYINPQKDKADIILKFYEKRDGTVHLDFELVDKKYETLANAIITLYNKHREFLSVCKNLSVEYDMVQAAGGNFSYKDDSTMFITSSGKSFSDVSILDGFSACSIKEVPTCTDEPCYNDFIDSLLTNKTFSRPSMETGMHMKIADTVVLHTHPIYVNTILCSREAFEVMDFILADYDFDFVPYYTPGFELSNNFSPGANNIFLLENHGLICSGESFSDVFYRSLKINSLCKHWLVNHSNAFTSFSGSKEKEKENGFLFPDAVVLREELSAINSYMVSLQNEVGLTSKFLSENEEKVLMDLESEKYRRSLQ
mgnify:CR=1 FL=1